MDTADTPETLQTMLAYLLDFDEALSTSSDGRELPDNPFAWPPVRNLRSLSHNTG